MSACGHWDPFAGALYAVLGERRLCAGCWKAAGRPFPGRASAIELDEARVRNQQAMLKHGGTSRHLVRKGIA